MNSVRFGAGCSASQVQPQFAGRFNKDEMKDKARHYEKDARDKGTPDKVMKAGVGMMLLTLLPGPQNLLLPFGLAALGGGWLWKQKKD